MMGSSMTCKQQYCCGNMRDCTGPKDPPKSQRDKTTSTTEKKPFITQDGNEIK